MVPTILFLLAEVKILAYFLIILENSILICVLKNAIQFALKLSQVILKFILSPRKILNINRKVL